MQRSCKVSVALGLGLAASLVANVYLLSCVGTARGALEKPELRLRAAAKASESARLLLPLMARGKVTKSDIIQALQRSSSAERPREENGVLVVGGLILRFDPSGTLVDVGEVEPGIID